MKHKVVDLDNKEVGEIEINDSIFCSKIFPDLIYNYVKFQMSKKLLEKRFHHTCYYIN